MKKYKLYIGIIAAFAGTLFSSCSDYLDVNDNPNYPSTTDITALLPSAEASTIAQIGLNGDLIGSLWMQYVTQGNTTNQYNTTANYTLTTSSYNAFWTNAYANTLPDLELVITKSEESGDWNYWAVAKILKAYNYHILTDFYGDIPFTEALNVVAYPFPKYDSSKDVVYPGIIALLDEAIAKAADAKATRKVDLTSKDFFLEGDIDNWIAFAKTLKLKLYMRDFDNKKSEIQALLSSGGLLSVDCAFGLLDDFKFEDAANRGNPLYEYNIRQLNTKENIRACHTFLEFLLVHEDPRVEAYYELTAEAQNAIADGDTLTNSEKYEGLPCGTKPTTAVIALARSSRYLQKFSDPVYLMNLAEVHFLKAEAYVRLGNTSQAKTEYEAGVTAAFDRLGFKDSAAAFIAAGGDYEFDETSTDTMLKSILTQKWVSYAKANSWDGWLDRNRTGFPAITSGVTVRQSNAPQNRTLSTGYVLGTLVDPGVTTLQPGEIPRRLLLPVVSTQYNPNAPVTKPLTEPLWWQVQ